MAPLKNFAKKLYQTLGKVKNKINKQFDTHALYAASFSC